MTVSPTLGQQFGVLINVAVVLSLIVYAYCCLALLRFAGAIAEPGARTWARLAAVTGFAFCLWVVLASGTATLAVAAGLLAATLPIWWVLTAVRRRAGAAGGSRR